MKEHIIQSQYLLLSTEIHLMLMEFKDRKKSNPWASRQKLMTLWKKCHSDVRLLMVTFPEYSKAMG